MVRLTHCATLMSHVLIGSRNYFEGHMGQINETNDTTNSHRLAGSLLASQPQTLTVWQGEAVLDTATAQCAIGSNDLGPVPALVENR